MEVSKLFVTTLFLILLASPVFADTVYTCTGTPLTFEPVGNGGGNPAVCGGRCRTGDVLCS
jgi:hypothetical protein